MRKLFKFILILITIFAIAGLVFTASHKIKTAQAYSDGSLVKVTGNPNIYVINNGMKVWVRSINVFNSCSYNWAAVQNVASINYLPKTVNLIKVASNPDVYRLEKNFKRKFRSAAVLDSYGLHWEDIATVCPAVLDSYSTAPLFKDSSARVYKVGSDFVRHVYNNMATFYADGMSTKDIIDINDSEIYSYDAGAGVPNTTQPISCLQEGETDSSNPLHDPTICCAGLTQIKASYAWGNDSSCSWDKLGIPWDVACTYCGNGVCGTGENKCNCPTDCK